jgi:hypothetical protein
MSAARAGCTDMVQVLLEKGADVNAKNQDGDTALTYATKKQNEWEKMKNLYALLAKSHDGKAKEVASTFETGEQFEDIVRLLKKSGAKE